MSSTTEVSASVRDANASVRFIFRSTRITLISFIVPFESNCIEKILSPGRSRAAWRYLGRRVSPQRRMIPGL